MRLKRLDLSRYGKFTDHSIDFGDRKEGQSDLHIVYGPNEAGKSTALAAFLDLLFGIGMQSRFNFLHPYPTMRVGGALEIAGRVQEFIRIKRPQNSLLDGRNQPIAEGAILGELGGIDRESYRTMFSLDDETLEAGGESILASKSDLGQLLFSASAGLADLSRSLVDLRAEADGFYKYRARSGELPELKARLAELKAERERIDTVASDYAVLVEARDRAASQYEETIASRGRIQARMDEIQRHLSALPRLSALRSICDRLAPLASLPDAPRGWAEELPKLQKDEIKLDVRAQGIASEIEKLSAELDSIVLDEAALRLAGRVESLTDPRARHMTAEKDIPERRLQLREAELVITGILGRIERDGEADPRRLILGASLAGRLRELIEARSGIDAASRSAASELSEARSRLDEARARLCEAGDGLETAQGREAGMASLAAAVAAVRTDDHAARRRLAERSRNTACAGLADRLRELQPWQGDADELIGIPIPGVDMIQRWKSEIAEMQKRIDHHAGELERLTSETLRLEAERDAIGGTTGIVTDQEAASIRASREQAWADHRRRLDAASADNFESALRRDDIVTAGHLSHMAELAKFHQASRALAIGKADYDRASDLRREAAAALQALHGEIAGAVYSMAPSLPDRMSLPQIEAWLARREMALEARRLARAAEQDLREAEAQAAAAREKLTAALDDAGVRRDADAGFEALLAAAQAAIDREAALRALRTAVQERQRDVAARERAAEQAAAEAQGWDASWAKACSACWLGERGDVPPLAMVREILAAIAELGPALEQKASLADRISKMGKDQASFREAIAALAGEMQMASVSGTVLDLAEAINGRIREAAADHARQAAAAESLKGAGERQRALAEALAIHDRRRTEMSSFFGAGSLAEVASKLSDLEKRNELRTQKEDAEREILDALRLSTMAEAEGALDATDRAALEVEFVELKARFEDQDQRCRELFSSHSKAADRVEAIGGDSKVAEIEERRRTTLLEIEDGALRYMRLRAGTAATEQALRAYRDQHRSSMMARASEAFRTISRGIYSGLATQPEKDSETLIALPASGGSKEAGELSNGTRFQLYLALRVAGYHEFARFRRPVPFIADDIMETFDDFRAEEAFRLFAGMAEVGQVIYLTHHRHLCDIAQRVCPAAQIHRLTPHPHFAAKSAS